MFRSFNFIRAAFSARYKMWVSGRVSREILSLQQSQIHLQSAKSHLILMELARWISQARARIRRFLKRTRNISRIKKNPRLKARRKLFLSEFPLPFIYFAYDICVARISIYLLNSPSSNSQSKSLVLSAKIRVLRDAMASYKYRECLLLLSFRAFSEIHSLYKLWAKWHCRQTRIIFRY